MASVSSRAFVVEPARRPLARCEFFIIDLWFGIRASQLVKVTLAASIARLIVVLLGKLSLLTSDSSGTYLFGQYISWLSFYNISQFPILL